MTSQKLWERTHLAAVASLASSPAALYLVAHAAGEVGWVAGLQFLGRRCWSTRWRRAGRLL